jgi:hypothetical protein
MAMNKKAKSKGWGTGSAAKLAQSIALGSEPNLKGLVTDVDLIRAFTWYNSERTPNDARDYLFTYASNVGLKNPGWINRIPDNRVPYAAAWLARIINLGGVLPEQYTGRIEQRLREIKNYSSPETVSSSEKKIEVSVQDKVKAKVDDFLTLLEGQIDDDMSVSLYDLMTSKSYPSTAVKTVIDVLSPRRDDINAFLSGKLKDGFGGYTKTELKARLGHYNRWIAEAQRYGDNKKIVRKPRTPKPVSADKLTKNIKFQAECKTLKVVSVPLTNVIGAKEVWLYNTRYGNLTVLKSGDRGMSFKASKIVGYDETISVTKKVSRKADYYVSEVLNRTKSKLKKLMDEAKTKPATLMDRVNENTLILRVFSD